MAYMDQQKKAKIALALKAVMPAGWKYSLSVRDHSSITMTISQAPYDLVALVNERNAKDAAAGRRDLYRTTEGYIQLNQYHLDSAFEGPVLEILEAAKKALYSADFYDNSDAQTDYFDCAYYVDMHVGKYDKPFVFVG